MRASDVSRFSPPVSPSNDTCRWLFVLVCLLVCLFVCLLFGLLCCFFPVLQVSWDFLKSSARVRPR